MSLFLLALYAALFFTFVHTSYFAFDRGQREPVGMIAIRFLSLAFFIANLWLFFGVDAEWPIAIEPFRCALGAALWLASSAVFYLAMEAIDRVPLRVAFSDLSRDALLTSGVYRLSRHPLYTSYLLYWWGWVAISGHVLSSAAFACILTAIYWLAARTEERLIRARLPDAYARYSRQTGRFFPRLTALAGLARPEQP